jgi:hypothetical protein
MKSLSLVQYRSAGKINGIPEGCDPAYGFMEMPGGNIIFNLTADEMDKIINNPKFMEALREVVNDHPR